MCSFGPTPPARVSSTSSAATRSGAATTPTPSTATRPIDPTRTYRVTWEPGDAVYMSLTVYGGPNDGRYSERIVGAVNSRDAGRRPDGTIRIVLSPDEPDEPGVAHIRLEPDAVAAITRDYLEDPVHGRRAVWHIEADDPPDVFTQDDADLARRLRAMTTWVRDQAGIVPLPPATPNTIDPPYPVPTTTFGWAAGDAAYAMGAFELADDEALVIRGRSPECVFWNMCLWNRLLHTYNYDYERVTINGDAGRVRARRLLDHRRVGAATRAIPTGSRRPATERPHLVPLVPPRRDAPAARGRGGPGGLRVSDRPPPVRIDDLAEPRFSDEARAILDFMREAGSQLTLDPTGADGRREDRDRVSTTSAPTDFVARLDLLCRAMRDEGGFNGAGIMQQHTLILGLLKNRLLDRGPDRPSPRDPRRARSRPRSSSAACRAPGPPICTT